MSIFKRLSTTLVSRIDQVVGEIENHDAVVQATLDDMRKKVAEARVRLGHVQREEQRLQEQIREQQENAERWRKRAVETAKDDEAKALECLSRRKHCQIQAEKLQQSLGQYRQASEKLSTDIASTEQRLAEVKQKLTLMRARQSTSSALKASVETQNDAAQLLENTFDRWEINISQTEMMIDDNPVVDPIEREFVMREQQDELREELDALLNKEKAQ
ncbi:MAG: PspA/IM30 family protein [Pseudomonadota bacterium]|nr:PspA/IM30 family protein [Pseudomonadota bacterium]